MESVIARPPNEVEPGKMSRLTRHGLDPRVDTPAGGDIATSKFKSFHVRDPDAGDLQTSNQTQEKHEP